MVLYSFSLNGQDSFTLNQAIEFGLINNSNSKNAVNDLKIANAKKWETISTGLPQINSFIEYNNKNVLLCCIALQTPYGHLKWPPKVAT